MDRRQKKTRDAIFSAFAELLSQKHYNQISVQEIIDAANVGRTTFYAHFETKDYLLKSLCEELFGHIIDTAMGLPHGHYHYSCGNKTDSVFLHLVRHLQDAEKGLLKSATLPEDYLVNHIASSFVETIDWWVSRGMKETPETITEYFLSVIEPVLRSEE